jgi:superfamily II DNA/RNA helicase
MSFDTLGLSKKVLDAVISSGYTTPTPIQEQAIPHVLARRDVMGIAQTGTGKTASFVLPMLSRLETGRARARMPRTLILEPTRELAAQVEENFNRYGRNHKLNVALLIGGVSFDEQLRKLDRGADVLIATPGRMLDHYERGKLLLTGVEILVIDEADRMLDMGFIPDIERIVKLVPFTRQTLFFSATMPPEIERLSKQFLQNPVTVSVSPPSSTSKTITQRAVACPNEDFEKRAILRDLIRDAENLKNAIIFCNRKVDVSNLWKSLEKHGFSVGALHGDMDQRSRMAMLQGFKDNKIQLLVASDVAARGLDIPDVSHVFNFDVPISAEDYVHRIGRTGRAGRSGAAFMLVTPGDRKAFEAIEALISEKVEWLSEPPQWDDRARRGGRGRAAPAGKGSSSAREGKREDGAAKSGRREHRASGDSPKRREPREESAASPQSTEASDAPERNERPRREQKPRRERTAEASPELRADEAPRESGGPDARKSGRHQDGPRDGGRQERPRKSGERKEAASQEVHDNDHPFGGEENIPAFLRG